MQVGVIIIPRKYIMGQVDERAFKTLVILISAALCILVIGCVCILILTNGVSKEMNLRAELISQLEARRKAEASSNYKSQFLANMRLVFLKFCFKFFIQFMVYVYNLNICLTNFKTLALSYLIYVHNGHFFFIQLFFLNSSR